MTVTFDITLGGDELSPPMAGLLELLRDLAEVNDGSVTITGQGRGADPRRGAPAGWGRARPAR
jgi:hypothetical protein